MEDTCPSDWVTFAYALSGVVLLVTAACVVLHRKSYAPLRARNPPLLAAMCFAGILHIISVVVADDHFVRLSRFEHANCVMWNFWLPYFLGLLPWYCCMFLRIVVYSSSFSMRLSELGSARVLKYRWAVVPFIAVPLLLLFSWTTLAGGSYFDPEIGRCQSGLVYKILLLVWIVFWALLLLSLSYFARRTIRQDYEGEFETLCKIAIVGCVVLAANAIGILMSLQTYCLGRAAITANVVSLHLFSVLSLAGVRMYRAVARSQAYDNAYARDQQRYAVPLESADELVDMPHIKDDFLNYCTSGPRIQCENTGVMKEGSDRLVDPGHMVQCYKKICEWEEKYHSMSEEEIKQRHLHIVQTHLWSTSPAPVCAHMDLVSLAMNTFHKQENTFSEIRSWIYTQLDREFGAHYMRKEAPGRRPWSRQPDQQHLLQCAETKKARRRLQKAGLLAVAEEQEQPEDPYQSDSDTETEEGEEEVEVVEIADEDTLR